MRHHLVAIGHEVGAAPSAELLEGSKLIKTYHPEWLTGKGAAIDDQRTLLNLHSSTAAVIVVVVDGHSSALPGIDAIAAVDAGAYCS